MSATADHLQNVVIEISDDESEDVSDNTEEHIDKNMEDKEETVDNDNDNNNENDNEIMEEATNKNAKKTVDKTMKEHVQEILGDNIDENMAKNDDENTENIVDRNAEENVIYAQQNFDKANVSTSYNDSTIEKKEKQNVTAEISAEIMENINQVANSGQLKEIEEGEIVDLTDEDEHTYLDGSSTDSQLLLKVGTLVKKLQDTLQNVCTHSDAERELSGRKTVNERHVIKRCDEREPPGSWAANHSDAKYIYGDTCYVEVDCVDYETDEDQNKRNEDGNNKIYQVKQRIVVGEVTGSDKRICVLKDPSEQFKSTELIGRKLFELEKPYNEKTKANQSFGVETKVRKRHLNNADETCSKQKRQKSDEKKENILKQRKSRKHHHGEKSSRRRTTSASRSVLKEDLTTTTTTKNRTEERVSSPRLTRSSDNYVFDDMRKERHYQEKDIGFSNHKKRHNIYEHRIKRTTFNTRGFHQRDCKMTAVQDRNRHQKHKKHTVHDRAGKRLDQDTSTGHSSRSRHHFKPTEQNKRYENRDNFGPDRHGVSEHDVRKASRESYKHGAQLFEDDKPVYRNGHDSNRLGTKLYEDDNPIHRAAGDREEFSFDITNPEEVIKRREVSPLSTSGITDRFRLSREAPPNSVMERQIMEQGGRLSDFEKHDKKSFNMFVETVVLQDKRSGYSRISPECGPVTSPNLEKKVDVKAFGNDYKTQFQKRSPTTATTFKDIEINEDMQNNTRTLTSDYINLQTKEFLKNIAQQVHRVLVTQKLGSICPAAVCSTLKKFEHDGPIFESEEALMKLVRMFDNIFVIRYVCGRDMISARTDLRICGIYTNDQRAVHACTDLHICKYFILSDCKSTNCKFGHDLATDHNRKVLNSNDLFDMKTDSIKYVMQNFDSRNTSTTPLVCRFYNNPGGCKKSNTCTFLHLCLHYINGDCKFGQDKCTRSHDLRDEQPLSVLERHGIIPDYDSDVHILSLIKDTLREDKIKLKRDLTNDSATCSPRGITTTAAITGTDTDSKFFTPARSGSSSNDTDESLYRQPDFIPLESGRFTRYYS